MSRGGAREGAGRPPGSQSRRTELLADAAAKGEVPLDYMLRVMRDAGADERRRDDMAKSAAPFLHAKYANIEHTGKDGGALKVELVRFADDTDTSE